MFENVSDGVVVGEDGRNRCAWAASTAEYRAHHDDEWGRPVGNDVQIYEKLCLEGFQAGLSWITILRKRPAFRRAFAEFDPEKVAAFGPGEVEALLSDVGIVRHRGKIEAVITNARAVMALHGRGLSLAGLVWSHRPATKKAPEAPGDLEASTVESRALSRVSTFTPATPAPPATAGRGLRRTPSSNAPGYAPGIDRGGISPP